MAIIARLFTVMLGYMLGCIAAASVLALGALTPQFDQFVPQGLPAAALWVVVGVGAAFIAAVALLPALLVIVLAEAFAWRSVVLYGALGGVLALALCYGIDFAGYIGKSDSIVARENEVLAASGIAGGLVYWAFAGRKAGARKW
ncbi:MAG: hypothetical protein WBF58_08510 [Xanthobacteraceae bacterium]